ncbi:hypothetical protein KKE14_02550 [Patescibacteria group bacterium]|nr:hypothetical protein [Patescibacteria group bacterium]
MKLQIKPIYFIVTGGIILLASIVGGYYSWKQSATDLQAWAQSTLEDSTDQIVDEQINNSDLITNKPKPNLPSNNTDESSQEDNIDNSTPSPDEPADIPTNEDNKEDSPPGGSSPDQTPWGQGPSDQ